MTKHIGKDVLGAVKKRTGKSISEKDINKLASGVKPSTMQSEAELKKLIKKVGAMAGVPVSDALTKEIVSAVKKSGMNPNNMEQLMKMMMK
ncbi:stage VI sporulation protein F [Paenibacillus sp.]|uniref:stage VI sporulation protein F n=1 Tax=Paenibacillus sp. TaxID=58172 RepID=UPI002D6C8872|nr:stage VI sporulation protein F [Paenibacillus sp.]HZG57479.1 stage VI sporulation protein F [Paenibacillus sp.]